MSTTPRTDKDEREGSYRDMRSMEIELDSVKKLLYDHMIRGTVGPSDLVNESKSFSDCLISEIERLENTPCHRKGVGFDAMISGLVAISSSLVLSSNK